MHRAGLRHKIVRMMKKMMMGAKVSRLVASSIDQNLN